MSLVTVLIPTHDHADTIRYAIASVQAQTVQDFELFVVGDGAPSRTDTIMEALGAADPRICYFPNPKGEGNGESHRAKALEHSRGEIVCYLGDDDLWLSDHLEVMVSLLASADFAHTNQVDVRPDGSLTVLAGDLNAVVTRKRMQEQKWNFFGPSCAGHTMAAYRKLPAGWRPRPERIWSDLHMWRQWLEQPWCRFHSEPSLTMLHFPSPLRQGWSITERVEELERWWERIRQPGFRAWLERQRQQDWQRRPPLQPLLERVVIEQSNDPRALDWHLLEQGDRPFRWSGPNPRPKILIPYTAARARIAIQIVSLAPGAEPQGLSVFVGDCKVDHTTEVDANGTLWMSFVTPLSRLDYTIITLHTPVMFCPDDISGNGDKRSLGLAAADMILEPQSD